MTVFYILLLIILLVVVLWLSEAIALLPDTVSIVFGNETWQMSSAQLIIILLIIFAFLYMTTWLLRSFLTLGERIKQRKQSRLRQAARQDLTQGLLHMIEGHDKQASLLLTQSIEHSDTPTLNYLALANIAQHHKNFEKRDQFLGKADTHKPTDHSAIAIAQAKMQMQSKQYEQARATLTHLLDNKPNHGTAAPMLMDVFFQQKDWKNLIELSNHFDLSSNPNCDTEQDCQQFELEALRGMFATQRNVDEIQQTWRKLPNHLRDKTDAIYEYTSALSKAGANEQAAKLILTTLPHQWDDRLIECYGLMHHDNLNVAILQAEHLLPDYDNNPALLLSLARLYKRHQLWGKAYRFYELSINRHPNALAYLELAELLESIDDNENAAICYQQGLRYSIYQKGEVLNLKHLRKPI